MQQDYNSALEYIPIDEGPKDESNNPVTANSTMASSTTILAPLDGGGNASNGNRPGVKKNKQQIRDGIKIKSIQDKD